MSWSWTSASLRWRKSSMWRYEQWLSRGERGGGKKEPWIPAKVAHGGEWLRPCVTVRGGACGSRCCKRRSCRRMCPRPPPACRASEMKFITQRRTSPGPRGACGRRVSVASDGIGMTPPYRTVADRLAGGLVGWLVDGVRGYSHISLDMDLLNKQQFELDSLIAERTKDINSEIQVTQDAETIEGRKGRGKCAARDEWLLTSFRGVRALVQRQTWSTKLQGINAEIEQIKALLREKEQQADECHVAVRRCSSVCGGCCCSASAVAGGGSDGVGAEWWGLTGCFR